MLLIVKKLPRIYFLFQKHTQYFLIIASEANFSSVVQNGALPKVQLIISECTHAVPPIQAVA